MPAPDPRTTIHLLVNGSEQRLEVEDRWTLAEVLRDHLHLTGTKIGCDRGECGACTVLLDGKPVYSCSQLAVWVDGKTVQTVEGLITRGQLDPLQRAFIDHDAPQCGFCTSGQLMAAKALVTANRLTSIESGRSPSKGTERPERQARQQPSETQNAAPQKKNASQGEIHISLGMTQEEVRRTLGDPIGIETAGSYIFWQYSPMNNQKYVVFDKVTLQVWGWRGL